MSSEFCFLEHGIPESKISHVGSTTVSIFFSKELRLGDSISHQKQGHVFKIFQVFLGGFRCLILLRFYGVLIMEKVRLSCEWVISVNLWFLLVLYHVNLWFWVSTGIHPDVFILDHILPLVSPIASWKLSYLLLKEHLLHWVDSESHSWATRQQIFKIISEHFWSKGD